MEGEITEDFVKAWEDTTIESACEYFRKNGRLSPMLYFLKKEKDGYGLGVYPCDTNQTKDEEADKIKMLCKRLEIVALVFANEAWMVNRKSKTSEEREKLMSIKASQEPDRIETLFFSCENIFWNRPRFFKVINKEGKKDLEDITPATPHDEAGGRFIGLLHNPNRQN